jgi:O-antigen/teichoic acid export membrane protein
MASTQRSRQILTSSATAAAARVVTVACSFVAMPMCLAYLGVPAFGVWAAITSIVAFMAFADLGIGNGVLNLLSQAFGRDDAQAIRQIMATALAILAGLGAAGFAVFVVLHPFVRWDILLGAQAVVPAPAVASAVFVFAVVFAINLPTTLIQRMQFALQQGHINGVVQAGSGVLSLVLIFLVTKTSLGLPGAVAATLAAPVLTTLASAVWMRLRVPEYLPSRHDFTPARVRPILTSGLQFLFLGLAFCLAQMSDSLVIANTVGAADVASFAVHQKLASPIAFIGGMALTPLWAAYGEALARGDVTWIKQAFRRSLAILAIAGLGLSVLLMLSLEPLMHLWLRGRLPADPAMAAALLVWVSVELIGKAVSVFLHGMGMVAQQLWIAAIFLPVCLAAKVFGGLHYGATGVVVGTTIAYVVVHAWPYWRLVREWHRRTPLQLAAGKAEP